LAYLMEVRLSHHRMGQRLSPTTEIAMCRRNSIDSKCVCVVVVHFVFVTSAAASTIDLHSPPIVHVCAVQTVDAAYCVVNQAKTRPQEAHRGTPPKKLV